MTRRQQSNQLRIPEYAVDMAPALLKLNHYIEHEIRLPSEKYHQSREQTKKVIADYLAKLEAVQTELIALDELLTKEMERPTTTDSTTQASRYMFAQKALRLEELLRLQTEDR